METAKLFRSGRSQAVRLPKAFRFGGDEVYVKRVGPAVILLPATGGWDLLFTAAGEFTDDFLTERAQPEIQSRAGFES